MNNIITKIWHTNKTVRLELLSSDGERWIFSMAVQSEEVAAETAARLCRTS